MATKMVANFRRSLSFPNHPSSSTPKPKKTLHVRSTSLPCSSHPLISQLKYEINELKTFVATPESRSSSWLCECLGRLKIVHESLDDLLQLPQTRESLCGHVELTEKLLEDFLRFVDVYGMFRTLVLTLKEEHMAAQVAARRKDDSKMALYVKGLKKIRKEMDNLVHVVLCMGRYYDPMPTSTLITSMVDGDVELVEALKDVVRVTVLVSIALIHGLSISLPLRRSSSSWMGLASANKAKKVKAEEGIQEFQQFGFENLLGLRKKGEEEVKMVSKRMHDLEDCIVGIETGSEKVFRSLIDGRVSLLNILT